MHLKLYCSYKLSNLQNDNYFHSKWSKVVILRETICHLLSLLSLSCITWIISQLTTPYTDVDRPNDTTLLFYFVILLQENQAKTKQFLGNTTHNQWLWVNGAPRGLELFFYDDNLLEYVIRCLKEVHNIDVIGVFSGLIRTWTQNQRGGE